MARVVVARSRSSRKSTRGSFVCGSVSLDLMEHTTIRGHTFSGEKTSAKAAIFRVAIPDNEHIVVAYAVWSTGERDVRAMEVESSSRALRRLEHGLRMGVDQVSATVSVFELRQARIRYDDPKQWSNCFKATQGELRAGAGVDVFRILRQAGALAAGTKYDVLGECGRHRAFLCATCERNAVWPPVVGYVLTRILPLLRGYMHEN